MEDIIRKAKRKKMHILLPEGTDERTQRAAAAAVRDGLAVVTLLGDRKIILRLGEERGVDLSSINITDPLKDDRLAVFSETYFGMREKKGLTREEAETKMKTPLYFGAMLLKEKEADGLIAGALHATSEVLHAGLQIVRTLPTVSTVSACYIMSLPNKNFGANGLLLFADCSITPEPTAAQMADIAVSTASTAKALCGIEPNVAMLSFSTKGSTPHCLAEKVSEATKLAQSMAPDLNIDGEMQADAAVTPSVGESKCPESSVAGRANVLVFPDLQAANISYKLVQRLAEAQALGPVSQGFRKPFNDLSRGCSTEDIYNLIAITAVQAQEEC